MGMIPFPDKKYDVIYADPPWQCYGRQFSRGQYIEDYYNTMQVNQICQLPINLIAHPDCWLFIWVVDSMLKEALEVCDAWGFAYKRSFIWDKGSIGMGVYNRAQHEQLFMAKRGLPDMPSWESLSGSVVRTKRGTHSEKPWIVRDIIAKMFPTQSKIELFARTPELLQPASGWDVWGNEA